MEPGKRKKLRRAQRTLLTAAKAPFPSGQITLKSCMDMMAGYTRK